PLSHCKMESNHWAAARRRSARRIRSQMDINRSPETSHRNTRTQPAGNAAAAASRDSDLSRARRPGGFIHSLADARTRRESAHAPCAYWYLASCSRRLSARVRSTCERAPVDGALQANAARRARACAPPCASLDTCSETMGPAAPACARVRPIPWAARRLSAQSPINGRPLAPPRSRALSQQQHARDTQALGSCAPAMPRAELRSRCRHPRAA
ncbi:MAG: hypothetical protein RL684_378, partial [Pseudomonadota bacterium]